MVSKYLHNFNFDVIFTNTNGFENLFCCMIRPPISVGDINCIMYQKSQFEIEWYLIIMVYMIQEERTKVQKSDRNKF